MRIANAPEPLRLVHRGAEGRDIRAEGNDEIADRCRQATLTRASRAVRVQLASACEIESIAADCQDYFDAVLDAVTAPAGGGVDGTAADAGGGGGVSTIGSHA